MNILQTVFDVVFTREFNDFIYENAEVFEPGGESARAANYAYDCAMRAVDIVKEKMSTP